MLEQLIEEAAGTPPIDLKAFYAAAYAQYQTGQWSKAIELFRILCERVPLESKFWLGLAASYQEQTDYELALFAWAMHALLEPANPLSHFHAAQCAFSLGKQEEAALALQEAKQRLSKEDPLFQSIQLLEERWSICGNNPS